MEFKIKNINKSINDLMRTIGYRPAPLQKTGETSIVRQLGGNDYPRFHLYIRQSFDTAQAIGSETQAQRDKLNTFAFNLHLDQKKPSYQGSRAHSGEYEGELVEAEANRIRDLLKS